MKRHGRTVRIGEVILTVSRAEGGMWRQETRDREWQMTELFGTKREAMRAFTIEKFVERRAKGMWNSRWNFPPVGHLILDRH